MNTRLFHTLSLSARPLSNRRGALVALLGGAIGALGQVDGVARKKRKRKRRKCPCPGDRVRLANGTCAAGCETAQDCLGGCDCKSAVEAVEAKHCIVDVPSCDPIPQECEGTADCPLGQHCQGTGCGSNRCVSVCA